MRNHIMKENRFVRLDKRKFTNYSFLVLLTCKDSHLKGVMEKLFLYIKIIFVAFLLFSVVAAIAVFRIGDEEVGGSASGEHLERIKKSPNYDGSKFVNAEPTEHLAEGNYWNLISDYFFSSNNRRPS